MKPLAVAAATIAACLAIPAIITTAQGSDPVPQVSRTVVFDETDVAQSVKVRIPRSMRTPRGTYPVRVRILNSAVCTWRHRPVSSRVVRLTCTQLPASGRVKGVVESTRYRKSATFVYQFTTGPSAPQKPPAGSASSYAFMLVQDDGVSPIRWDPCQGPIDIVTSGEASDGDYLQALTTSVERIRQASGLAVRIGGATGFVPDKNTVDDSDPATEVVIWAGPRAQQNIFSADSDAVAMAGFTTSSTAAGLWRADVGFMVVDSQDFAQMDSGMQARLYMHELGHVIGLDHVDDTGQVMYPTLLYSSTDFGTGDLAGLTAVGASAGCVP